MFIIFYHLGLAQGMVTGMRGLCNGLGPAVFGLIFYLFHVDLNEDEARLNYSDQVSSAKKGHSPPHSVEFTNRTVPVELQVPVHHHQENQLLGEVKIYQKILQFKLINGCIIIIDV